MGRRSTALGSVLAVFLVAGGILAPPALAAPANDDFADATDITAIPYTDSTSTVDATNESGEPEICGLGSNAIWYRYSPADDGPIQVDTFGSDYDTAIAVYTGGDLGSLEEVACNDDTFSLQSAVSFDATAGETYHIQAGGFSGDTGALTLNVGIATGIGGTVTNTALEPLTSMCVTAWKLFTYEDEWEYWQYWDAVSWDITAEDGTYFLGNLGDGEHKVSFEDCNDGSYVGEFYDDKEDVYSADAVTVIAGSQTMGIDAVLTLGGIITGTITDVEGAALGNLCVQAFHTDSGRSRTGWTDANGNYEIRGLIEGAHKVRFNRCTYYDGGPVPVPVPPYEADPEDGGAEASLTIIGHGRNPYEIEWFDDKTNWDTADLVDVVGGVVTPDIDAVLGLRPRPDVAVTNLRVSNTRLQTDAAELPGTGLQRTVDLTVDNVGTKDARRARIRVEACPRTAGSCDVIFDGFRRVNAGGTLNLSLDWNGVGMLGDMTVRAIARTPDDADRSNDQLATRHYVGVGGTGVGIGCPSSFLVGNVCWYV